MSGDRFLSRVMIIFINTHFYKLRRTHRRAVVAVIAAVAVVTAAAILTTRPAATTTATTARLCLRLRWWKCKCVQVREVW